MQVNLLALSDAAVVEQRIGAVLLTSESSSFEPLLQHQKWAHSARAQQDDDRGELAAAGQGPLSSADATNEAERNVDRTSRAFSRQEAHDSGVEQFRQERQELRQALRAERPASTPPETPTASGNTKPGAAPSLPSGPQGPAALQARSASPDRVEQPATQPASGAADGRAAAAAVPQQAAVAGQPARTTNDQQATPATTGVVEVVAGRELTGSVNAIRSEASGQVRPAATTSVKGSAQPSVGSSASRGETKADGAKTAKTTEARAAETADRNANTERIVRIVAQRLGTERSHTVMRLDPPELGSLRLQMDLKGDALALRIDSSTHTAHRLLSEDLDALRQGLEAAGIRLESIDVRPPPQSPESGESGDGQHAEWQGGGQESQPDAEHPEQGGRDSHRAWSNQATTGRVDPEPAAESLVDVVA